MIPRKACAVCIRNYKPPCVLGSGIVPSWDLCKDAARGHHAVSVTNVSKMLTLTFAHFKPSHVSNPTSAVSASSATRSRQLPGRTDSELQLFTSRSPWQRSGQLSVGLHQISYPAPAEIRPNFHIRPDMAAGYEVGFYHLSMHLPYCVIGQEFIVLQIR